MIYRFDRFAFDPDGDGLMEGGVPVALEPQVFSLLKYLLENRGTIVSKDELNDEVWEGRFVSDAALTTRIRTLRRALGDDHTQQKFIKTFPKRGYRFVASGEQAPVVADLATAPTTTGASRHIVVAATFLVIAFIVGMVIWWSLYNVTKQQSLPLPDKPSIAVMQFANLSGSEDDQYFVAGLTGEIIANLSRYSELFVSSRYSTFSFAQDDSDPKRLAQQLGIVFVAQGSVRRLDDRVRVNAELFDTRTGATVWAERFDRDLTDIFQVQSEISRAIAARLAPEIVKAETDWAHSKRTQDLNAWDLYLKAKFAQSEYTSAGQAMAIQLAQQAIDRDQRFAAPYSLIARAKGVQFFFGWSNQPATTLNDAISFARSALKLDPGDPVAYSALGYIYRFTGDETQAIANLERAVQLNPNDANIRLELAHTLDWFRKQDRALPQIELAIRLSPRDPLLQNMYFYKAHILFHLHRYEESLTTTRDMSGVITSDTWRVLYNLMRAANLAELGRVSEARQSVDAAVDIKPKLSLAAIKKQFEGSKNHPENRRIWLESLRKAGLPE